jgi:holo-ACP synthase/triphosphoribosyl-dephospho-CoA synthase
LSDDLQSRLAAREARHRKQVEFARKAAASEGRVAVTVNLNLPGDIDRYPWAALALDEARNAAGKALAAEGWDFAVLEQAIDAAGPHMIGMARSRVLWPGHALQTGHTAQPAQLMLVKQALTKLEEGHPRGRLWDMDVLDQHGRPVSRTEAGRSPRRCFVCDAPAHECRVLKRHSVEDAILAAQRLYLRPVVDEVLAGATAGILLEAAAWPSPGLVSPFDSGAHDDMNYLMFLLSASSISPRLLALIERARDFVLARGRDEDLPGLFRDARAAGVHIEEAMLAATAGANTHRGSVFALGMASVAAMVAWGRMALLGNADRPSPAAIAAVVRDMTRGLVARELESLRSDALRSQSDPSLFTVPGSLSRGQRLYLETGCTGIRGEVERGFPTVVDAGLPALEAGLEKAGLAGALTHSLITIMSVAEDSALAGRHSLDVLRVSVWPQARDALDAGSVFTATGRKKIRLMQEMFAERRLNPGGSGDLLAVAVAMYCWSRGSFTREQVLRTTRW